MKFKENMTMGERIDFLSRYIVIHSILYYEMDRSIIPDKKFDSDAKLLTILIEHNKEIAEQTHYWYVMHDFDGTTGFHLVDRLTDKDRDYLFKLANIILHDFRYTL